MKTIGSWWLAKVDAVEDEEIKHSYFANRTQSSSRAVGGVLFVTNRRCVFTPHLLDYVTGGATCKIALSEIDGVSVQPAGGDTFGGGLRDRLRLSHANGVDLFVVNKLNTVIATIQSLIGARA